MQHNVGKLEGRGEVRGPDGELKCEFVITTECSPEQAVQTAKALNVDLKETDHGSDTRSSR